MCIKRVLSVFTAIIFTAVFLVLPEKVYSDAVDDMDTIVKNYSGYCAVQVYSMDGENLYSYNIDSPVFCASVIKLPYADFVCKQITAGLKSMDYTVTYTSDWYHGGSGIIRHNGYGKAYTIRQLLDYMLRYSDNVAYDMLVGQFGTDGFNEMVAQWGYDVKLGMITPRWPNITSSFMRVSMEYMARHSNDSEAWRVAWNALNNSTDVLTRAVLGNENTPVAIKYGMVDYVYHEVCYIGCDTPYILIILTGITEYNYDSEFFKKTALCSSELIREYNENKPVKGDVNNDKKVDIADLVYLKRFLLAEPLKLEKPENADLCEDGTINLFDYRVMKTSILTAR